MSQNRSIKKKSDIDKGFSLIELLVVTAMLGLIMTSLYNVFNTQGKISRSQQSILEMQSDGRAAINFLSQSFSHAGFGTSESNENFLELTTGSTDTATIRYGYKVLGQTTKNATKSSVFDFDASISTPETIDGMMVSFFPSTSPNNEYFVNDVSTISTPMEMTIDDEIGYVADNAKIYEVCDIKFIVSIDKLIREEICQGITETIAHNVVCFKVAYSKSSPIAWDTNNGNVKPQAVYIYLVLRTQDKEPGFKQAHNFKLPWDNTTAPFTIENGYHYQSFQTLVWIRNAS